MTVRFSFFTMLGMDGTPDFLLKRAGPSVCFSKIVKNSENRTLTIPKDVQDGSAVIKRRVGSHSMRVAIAAQNDSSIARV
jgi:hypothetical protein